MIRYIIIDDEYIAHDIIKGYCDLLPNMELVQNCYDAIEALQFLSKNEVDLIFLDLNMPKLTGFDFLRTLSNAPNVIVTTAYKEHAIEGYELNIVDYLLKPFSFERFLKAINKLNAPEARGNVTGEASRETVFLKSGKSYVQVRLADIVYIEASGNYAKIFTKDEMIMIREKFSELLTMLDYSDIYQIHKSFAVAKSYIKSIEGNRILLDQEEVPIGKSYRYNVKLLLH